MLWEQILKSPLSVYLPSFILAFAVLFFGYDVINDLFDQKDTLSHIIVEFVVFSTTSYVFYRELRHVKELRHTVEQEKSKTAKMAGEMIHVMRAQFEQWQLTPTEIDVAFLLIKGLSMKEIAMARNTKEKTTRVHASNIYAKSGFSGRHELAAHFIADLLCNV